MFAFGKYMQWKNPMLLTQEAITPDFLLKNARLYIEEDAHDRSIRSLEDGIAFIQKINAEVDPESQEVITPAVKDLIAVHQLMKEDIFDLETLNEQCVQMLLALTFAQVKLAEDLIEKAEMGKAEKSIRFGMSHIKNALLLSSGTKKNDEVGIYSELNKIIKDPHMSKEEIKEILQGVLTAIKNLEVSFHN